MSHIGAWFAGALFGVFAMWLMRPIRFVCPRCAGIIGDAREVGPHLERCRKIEALSPPDRLRLAAALLEKGKAALAHTIAERVVLELGKALAAIEGDGQP